MKSAKWHVFLMSLEGRNEKLSAISLLTFHNVGKALEKEACRLFGKEGKDWRAVQDKTIIGFHVDGKGAFGDQWLEVR